MKKSEHFEKNNMDDMWVCDYCGTEEVDEKAWVNMNTLEVMESVDDTTYWCNICNDEASPLTYFEFKEKIAEECGGNKEKYHQILDGSRM